jgi:ATP-binding cassette subfamily F protein 3
MIQIRNLTVDLGKRVLLSGAEGTINLGRRIGLVGDNGVGKSTLLKVLVGERADFTGEIVKPRSLRIGYLPQEEMPLPGETVMDAVMTGNGDHKALEEQLDRLHQDPAALEGAEDHGEWLGRLERLQQRLEASSIYEIEAQAKKILGGLGLASSWFDRPLRELSGGWRMRVWLARLLCQEPDLLLLDEPTNHLDTPAMDWLESYLMGFPGAILTVSHDRFFLNRMVHEIWGMHGGKIHAFHGRYDAFVTWWERERELEAEKRRQIQEERERIERFIDKFRYKASKAKQVQSRIKLLDKMEPLPDLSGQNLTRSMNFSLTAAVRSYSDVLLAKGLSFRYGETAPDVLRDVNCQLYRGEKVAVVGANGAGKTTLTRLITGALTGYRGLLEQGERVTIGHFGQHQLDMLDPAQTAFEEISRSAALGQVPVIRDLLGLFGIRGEDVNKRIGILSGGEKARVSLVKILLSSANFIIMDEPTNHLDVSARTALEKALSNYDGTLLLISHDRYFLDQLVSRVWLLEDGQLSDYLGNYSEFLESRGKMGPAVGSSPSGLGLATDPVRGGRKEMRKLAADIRQRYSAERSGLEKTVRNHEVEIEALEVRKKALHQDLAEEAIYAEPTRVVEAQKELAVIEVRLADLIPAWEAAAEILEHLTERMNGELSRLTVTD